MSCLAKLIIFILLAESSWEQQNKSKSTKRSESKALQDVEEQLRTLPKLNLKQNLAMNQVLSFYALKQASNELCRNHSKDFSAGLRSFEPWALKSRQNKRAFKNIENVL